LDINNLKEITLHADQFDETDYRPLDIFIAVENDSANNHKRNIDETAPSSQEEKKIKLA